MSILAVGSIAFDSIATPSGRADSVVGGSATYFSLAASYFTDVRVVAVVGEDFTSEHESILKKRGVDTRGIEHAKGKTFRWGGHYLDNLNEAKTDFTELNVFEQFKPRIPTRIPKFANSFSGKYPSQFAESGPEGDEQGTTHRRRHHELLDTGLPQRTDRNLETGGYPLD